MPGVQEEQGSYCRWMEVVNGHTAVSFVFFKNLCLCSYLSVSFLFYVVSFVTCSFIRCTVFHILDYVRLCGFLPDIVL